MRQTNKWQRLDHSESNNFGLEFRGTIAKAQDQVWSYLTPEIVTGYGNVAFHYEWDNWNKTTTNVHGTIVDSAGGVIV